MSGKPAWYDAYPPPRNTSPPGIERKDLLALLQSGKRPGKDLLLLDLRRTDHEGGTIKGSINLPAQSLYYSLPTVLNLCQSAGIELVIWYCGSSRGRGTRAAGWFDDLIKEQNVPTIRSAVLKEGIAGWAKAGEEYNALMDEYSAEFWQGPS